MERWNSGVMENWSGGVLMKNLCFVEMVISILMIFLKISLFIIQILQNFVTCVKI